MSKTTYFKGRADYLIGFGLGTALSPILISILGVQLPEDVQLKVWIIGFTLLLIGLIIDVLDKRGDKNRSAKKSS